MSTPQPLTPADPAALRGAQQIAQNAAPPGFALYGLWRQPAAREGGPELLHYVYAPTWWLDELKSARESSR